MEKVNYIRSKYHYSWILLREMVKTDFKLRYQGSILGVIWSALKPMMLFAITYVVFVKFFRMTDKNIPNYATLLLFGISTWSFIAEATSTSLSAVVAKGDLLRKIRMPKYLVILTPLVSALINYSINIVIVIAFAIIFGSNFTWHVLFTPFIIFELIILVFSISMILGALFVKFRDIGPIWEVISQIIMYGTPIMWPISMVMSNHNLPEWTYKAVLLNPFAQIIQDLRYNLLQPIPAVKTVWNSIGQWYIQILPICFVIILFVLSVLFFKKQSKTFAEEV